MSSDNDAYYKQRSIEKFDVRVRPDDVNPRRVTIELTTNGWQRQVICGLTRDQAGKIMAAIDQYLDE